MSLIAVRVTTCVRLTYALIAGFQNGSMRGSGRKRKDRYMFDSLLEKNGMET